jgi:hypothetical protein
MITVGEKAIRLVLRRERERSPSAGFHFTPARRSARYRLSAPPPARGPAAR